MNQSITHQRIAGIFNEWGCRYTSTPEAFDDIRDDKGELIANYGERCAVYFTKLTAELDAAGKLPRPNREQNADEP